MRPNSLLPAVLVDDRRFLIGLAVAATVLRLIAIAWLTPGGLFSDEPGVNDGYHPGGLRLLATGGLDGFYKAPLFLSWVAGIYGLFGVHPWIVRVLNIALVLAGLVVVYATVRRGWGLGAARAAAAMLALGPWQIFFDARLMAETMHVVFVGAAIAALWRAQKGEPRRSFLAGFLGSAAALAKGSMYVFPVLASVALVVARSSWKWRVSAVLLFGLGFATLFVPWNAYKRWDGGEWNFTDRLAGNVWLGIVKYDGIGKSSDQDAESKQVSKVWSLPYQERHANSSQRLERILREDPLSLVRPWPNKLARFWGIASDSFQQFPSLIRLPLRAGFVLLYLLAMVGGWSIVRSGDREGALLVAAVCAAAFTLAGIHLLVTSHFRYSLPAQPWIAALGLRGALHLWATWSSRTPTGGRLERA